MKPILFEFGKIKIYGYGLMIVLGIIFSYLLLDKRRKYRGYSEDDILNLTIITVISSMLGGKLLYIIVEMKSIIKDPSVLFDFGSGFVIYGAIIGGTFGLIIYSKIKKWSVFKILDLISPSVPLAQGFGRIGCFLAGCCYGKETSLAIGVEFKSSPFAPSGVHLHPTQIYSSIFDFCLAIFLVWYGRKEREEGKVFSMYIILYSIGRFLVEFLRNDPRGNVGILSTSQFIAIFTFVIGVIIFNINKFKKKC